ncbi:hypothetical protein LCGC14_0586600 [marine sediment metagenome]|uniref:Uncharacterized protein n=1 Tax=marine sediment metagenome TaxID=412755 RepID=A0A0F9RJX8_9ZZZZ
MTTVYKCDKCKRDIDEKIPAEINGELFDLCEDCVYVTRLYLRTRPNSWESKKIREEHQRIERENA